MKTGFLILLIFGMIFRGRRQSAAAASPEGLPAGQEAAIARVKADIKKYGWHLLGVKGDGRPGFLYTIGLWETYKHPEIILFASTEDPTSMVPALKAVVDRVIAGEKLESGKVYKKVFKEHSGAVREVRPGWFPSFLGTGGAVYGNFDFPAVQLYWPDKEDRFPWQSGFDPKLFPVQPILYQDNVVLGNVGSQEVQQLVKEQGPQVLEKSLDDLFVRPGDDAKRDLLADWRWRVGPNAELFQVTLFGDLFLKTPDGHIHWLDTGSNDYRDIAADRESWIHLLCDNPALFFHASTLLHFRSLDYRPKDGEVYSWIKSPMLGGRDTVDNFGTASVFVHITHLGQMAQQLPAVRQKQDGRR